MELIEKMSEVLKIEPYHFFINRTAENTDSSLIKPYPKLPFSMKTEINDQIDISIKNVIKEILDKY